MEQAFISGRFLTTSEIFIKKQSRLGRFRVMGLEHSKRQTHRNVSGFSSDLHLLRMSVLTFVACSIQKI